MTDDGGGSGPESAWQRIRRHKVVEWTLAYAAAAYTILHGVEMLSGALEWPHGVVRVTTLLLLAGAPVAATLAWFHGHRAQHRVSGPELAALTLLLVGAGAVLWVYGRHHGSTQVGDAGGVTSAAGGVAAASDGRPSIAVLPFRNRSARPDDAFFVDGIQDDVLTQLSKVSALRVISRTSVERFRDTQLATRDIAAQLGVQALLEGGVQRAGDRVRINVQLIDARSDAHLWADSYDRELTAANIFAIQSEVAAAIAGQLRAVLKPAEKARVEAVPTRNLAAWESYQLGRQRLARRSSAALVEAERFFEDAVRLDPTFALAHVGLADTLSLQVDYRGLPREATLARAQAALDAALKIDPNLAEAVTSSAWLAFRRQDYAAAEAGFREAIELNPNYATARHWFSRLLAAQGRFDEAVHHAEQAARLDPLSAVINVNLGNAYEGAGRFGEAFARYQKAGVIDPSIPNPPFMQGSVQANALGRLDLAVPLFEKAERLDPGNPDCPLALAGLYLDLDDPASAEAWIDRAIERSPEYGPAVAVSALAHLYAGDRVGAMEAANRALDLDPRNVLALEVSWAEAARNGGGTEVLRRYERAFPDLVSEGAPKIDGGNYVAAIDVAALLQQTGRTEQAERLLAASEAYLRTLPRLGWLGYGVLDVRVFALRGRLAEALEALREAERAGWRGPSWRFERDFDPALTRIRSDPAFVAVFADIQRDLARQRAALAQRGSAAKPVGELAPTPGFEPGTR